MFLDALQSQPAEGWHRLGQGRLGDTWMRETAGGQRVVLKRLAGLAAAAGEAAELLDRIAAVPSCAAALGVEGRAGDLWVAYPFVTGRRPVEAAALGAVVGADIERAVAELHSAGLVHGALCDSNVRVTDAGEIRLLEAGLAGIGCLGVVGVATQADDRRDLAALCRQMGTSGVTVRRDAPSGHRRHRTWAAGVSAVVTLVAVIATMVLLGGHATTRRDVHRASADFIWNGAVIITMSSEGTPMRFSLGRPGDVLVVGHWSCSRVVLPAIYRRGTGQVFYFASWPVAGRALTSEPAASTGIRNGTARPAGTSRCQRVEVEP